MQVTILPALPADYPTLASILPLANAHNPIEHLMFRPNSPSSPTTDPSTTDPLSTTPTTTPVPSARWAMAQFHNAQTTTSSAAGTKTHILKAVVSDGGERGEEEEKAVGFAIVRVIDALPSLSVRDEGNGDAGNAGDAGDVGGKERDKGKGEAVEAAFEKTSDEMLDPEFCAMYMNGLKEIYENWAHGRGGGRHGCEFSPPFFPHPTPSLSPPFSHTQPLHPAPFLLPRTSRPPVPPSSTHAHPSGPEQTDWSTLMIHPLYQRRGIGTAVIEWALAHLGLDAMPVFICAQPDGRRLYERMGWREVGGLDVRLGEWAKKGEGLGMGVGGEGEGKEGIRWEGVHRTACMVREAGGGMGKGGGGG
ncbi:MAG: hypothetical protein L6R37_004653 [Teloschistes peruensis]|nr:MAG: hypothetical protein L6R37_004653 [Teloschistes peruensis]